MAAPLRLPTAPPRNQPRGLGFHAHHHDSSQISYPIATQHLITAALPPSTAIGGPTSAINMAPVPASPSAQTLQDDVKNVIQDLFQVMVQVSNYDAAGRSSRDTLVSDLLVFCPPPHLCSLFFPGALSPCCLSAQT